MSRRTCVLLRYFILMNSSILTRWIRKIPIALKGLPCYRAPLFAAHRNQNVRNRYFFKYLAVLCLCHIYAINISFITGFDFCTCTIAFKHISSWMFVQCFGYLTATSLQQFMLYYIIKISNDIGDGQCEFIT